MSTRKTAVVVAVDGTGRSAGALRYAAQQAWSSDSQLSIVHVSPDYLPLASYLPYLPRDMESEGHAILRDAQDLALALHPELRVVTDLLTGSRADAVLRSAAGATLLVVGHETRVGAERLLTGAVTAKIAARAQCPVVVVPSAWKPGPATGRVVLGIKSPSHADELMAEAFDVAAARGAALVLLHAWGLPDPYADVIEQRTHADQWVAEGEQMLGRILAEWREAYPDVPVETRVLHDSPADALVAAGDEADLVLLVRRARDLLPGHLGGVTRRVLQLSRCPVEILPASSIPLVMPDLVIERSGRLIT
ncbi:universal stress protein [Nocardioides sp.]|uniref:universal stress protein n=1 Tax=Nocardioides sp. TaxID=35761 RepID=UPI00286C622A|nr:universal stress protein [Nocardioides sp.]